MSTAISRQIVRSDTLNSRARLPYVSCLLRHNVSSNCWRRSLGLICSPPLHCTLGPMVKGNHDSGCRSNQNFYLKIIATGFIHHLPPKIWIWLDADSDFQGGARAAYPKPKVSRAGVWQCPTPFDKNLQKKTPGSLINFLAFCLPIWLYALKCRFRIYLSAGSRLEYRWDKAAIFLRKYTSKMQSRPWYLLYGSSRAV